MLLRRRVGQRPLLRGVLAAPPSRGDGLGRRRPDGAALRDGPRGGGGVHDGSSRRRGEQRPVGLRLAAAEHALLAVVLADSPLVEVLAIGADPGIVG